ncbi:MAG: hypothetical protein JO191_14645 [Mycobacteriaceae bacterium]|nr:hypothetical protein [Mycobacteriaceae bacterium]MBV9513068.1 hypothetical protein [Mycobacteriaceae bacterium]
MSLKSLTTGVAAATLVGAAAIGATSIAAVPTTAITPAVFGAPLPMDNDPALAGQLTGILNQLANGATITENAGLIQGGVGIIEGRTANRLLNNARQNGDLPLNLTVTNVSAPAPDGSVTATVNASGPKLAGTTQQVTFVPGGPDGWQVSKASATSLMQAAMASG